MTPKERAKELFDSYWYCLMQSNIQNRSNWSKECALIAVDEIQEAVRYLDDDSEDYWFEVKHEIEKL